jgi:hypothetical protein
MHIGWIARKEIHSCRKRWIRIRRNEKTRSIKKLSNCLEEAYSNALSKRDDYNKSLQDTANSFSLSRAVRKKITMKCFKFALGLKIFQYDPFPILTIGDIIGYVHSY